MPPPHYFTTPGGEELVIMTRVEYDSLLARLGDDDAEDAMSARIVDAALANPTLSLPLDVWDEIEAAPSPIGPLRRWRGETIESLAAKAGLSVTALSKIEAGQKIADSDTLEVLAQALRVHADDLLPDDE